MCTFDFSVTLRIHRNNSWTRVSFQRREEQNCIQRSRRSFRIILRLWTRQPFLERLGLSWEFFMCSAYKGGEDGRDGHALATSQDPQSLAAVSASPFQSFFRPLSPFPYLYSRHRSHFANEALMWSLLKWAALRWSLSGKQAERVQFPKSPILLKTQTLNIYFPRASCIFFLDQFKHLASNSDDI